MIPYIRDLVQSGVEHAPDSETIKRVILVNKISLVFFVAAITFMTSVYIANLVHLSLFVLAFMIAFMAPLFLNKKKQFLAAKLTLFLTISFGGYVYSAILGPSSGIQYLFLSLVAFGFGLFSSKEKLFKIFSVVCSIGCFFTLYATQFSFFYKLSLTDAALAPIYFTSLFNIFIIIWLTMSFYEDFTIHYKQHLNQLLSTYKLSEREGEVLVYVLNGDSNKTISASLFIEEGTVKNHLTSIYRKVNVTNRNELMAKLAQ